MVWPNMRRLGTKLWFSARAASPLSYWSLSSAPKLFFNFSSNRFSHVILTQTPSFWVPGLLATSSPTALPTSRNAAPSMPWIWHVSQRVVPELDYQFVAGLRGVRTLGSWPECEELTSLGHALQRDIGTPAISCSFLSFLAGMRWLGPLAMVPQLCCHDHKAIGSNGLKFLNQRPISQSFPLYMSLSRAFCCVVTENWPAHLRSPRHCNLHYTLRSCSSALSAHRTWLIFLRFQSPPRVRLAYFSPASLQNKISTNLSSFIG